MDHQHDTSSVSPDQDPRYCYIHGVILFADIENSVMLSATLPPLDYDNLLNSFQATMQRLVDDLREQGMLIGEAVVAGDQLSIFFYDPAEIERNWQLDGPQKLEGDARKALTAECQRRNEDLLFSALKAALQLKSRWLVTDFNQERVHAHREPLGLAIGLHASRVYLRERSDGRRRIEGFAVNLAKRVEGYARQGNYSRIMFSQEAHDQLRGIVVKHTQLRQRVFFHRHDVTLELLKGVTESQAVYELKFYSRIQVKTPPEVFQLYEDMFYINPHNIWAYYQLFEYYAYQLDDWDKVFKAVKRALLAYPQDEKLLLDLSRYYSRQGDLQMAETLARQALTLNPEFDLAYELLAELANQENRLDEQKALHYRALSLAPGSPANNLNIGLALCELGDEVASVSYLQEALRLYPDYTHRESTRAEIAALAEAGKLPEVIAEQFGLSSEHSLL